MMKHRYYGQKIDKKGWRPLLSKINKVDINLKPLCSISAIVKNAIDNHVNCGLYIKNIISGDQFAFNYNDDSDSYTILVAKSDNNQYKVIDVWKKSEIDVNYDQLNLSNIQPILDLINV